MGYRNLKLLVLLFLVQNSFAQNQEMIDISSELYQPVYKACQTETFEFPILLGVRYEQTPTPKTFYFRVLGSGSTCRRELVSENLNSTLKLEGNGVAVYSLAQKTGSSNYWFSNIQVKESGILTVSWQVIENYPPNGCGYVSKETTYIGKYKKIFSIPKPSKPVLTASRAVVRFPDSSTLTSTACPNTLARDTTNSYVSNYAYKAWSFECGTDGKPDFRNNFSLTPPDSYFDFGPQYFYYKPGTVFRARCDDNGCLSEISDPVAVTVQYVTPNCPDTETNSIDNTMRTARKDYHHYMLETEVCQKGPNNPNCTKDKVFALMKSRKDLMGPIASDIPETIPAVSIIGGWDLGNWETKVPLLGSDLVYKLDATPVSNCETVSLPSAFGMAANLAALSASGLALDTRPYYATRNATASSNFFANPIMQYIDEQGYTITNYTKEGHIFHPGKIVRIIVDECNRIKVITIGVGQHFFEDNLAGEYMSAFNASSGKLLFNNIDQRLIYEFNKLPK